jgi:hypothetical protein
MPLTLSMPTVGGKNPDLRLCSAGKLNVRNGQQRHTLETQQRAFGLADVFLVVDADAGRLDDPVRHPARPGSRLQVVKVALRMMARWSSMKIDPFGLAMPLVLEQLITGLAEKSFEGRPP